MPVGADCCHPDIRAPSCAQLRSVRRARETARVGVGEEWRHVRRWAPRHRRLLSRLLLVALATLVIDLVGTLLVYSLERGEAGDADLQIHTLFDAFFFTTVQLLTVSSQLPNPVTPGGRIVDIVLELWAVIVVAGSAGAVASFFAEDPRTSAPADDAADVRATRPA